MKKTMGFKPVEILLILFCFCVCLAGALLLSMDHCPDEGGRMLLTDWIVARGTLPTGNELEVINPGWGFSYALRPYLSSIVGALFVRLAGLFTTSERVLLAAARMCSVLSNTASCYFCLRLGHRLFERRSSAILLSVFVCFLPQAAFLGMYQNNDALSLFAACMSVCFFAEGYDDKWTLGSCVGLSVGLSIGLLSYYSVYGWLLFCALFCVAAAAGDPDIPDKGRLIASRTALIAGICLLLAGWFFLRNAMLHSGDFLGIASEQSSRETLREAGVDQFYSYISFKDRGLTLVDYFTYRYGQVITLTLRSFIGVLGFMEYRLSLFDYIAYCATFALAIGLYSAARRRQSASRRDRMLFMLMLLSTLTTVAMHLWHSYARDYQPQGRYVITAVLLLGYMLAYGADAFPAGAGARPWKRNLPATLAVFWMIMAAIAFAETMPKLLA